MNRNANPPAVVQLNWRDIRKTCGAWRDRISEYWTGGTMSYDIELVDPVTGETLELDEPHHMKGGTYAVGGMREAHLNVTYNYFPQFSRAFEDLPEPRPSAPKWMKDRKPVRGVRTIYGLTGAESLPVLDRAIGLLGDDVGPDYWKATDGNAKRALLQLRALAAMRPDGVWSGD